MRRHIQVRSALLVTTVLVAIGAMAPGSVRAVAPGQPAVPKVVLIVGPSGSATERYRAEARAAADVARQSTPDVTEIYSPDATWPAVRDALQGASLVVYMGHGNGWPSPYRDALYPPTQNGFGLNPKPGGDDTTHQYFGEGRIAAEIDLASHAVVLLHHLCYASGLSEPGRPEGTLDAAQRRVDNFAAGFIAAGADAVIAEAYAAPAGYVASILGGRRSVDAIWRTAPAANGHAFAFDSARSPGFVAQMDPATADAGFERSIVLKEGLVSADVLAGASGSPAGPFIADPWLPSLVQTGIRLGEPGLSAAPRAGSTVRLRIPYAIDARERLPDTLGVSLRWEALDRPAADPPPTVDLVVPEAPGAVVEPATLRIAKANLTGAVRLPETPGRYRLTITLHDDLGLAFDAATQVLVPALLVRVTSEVDGAILVPGSVTAVIGAPSTLPVRIANLGTAPWGRAPIDVPRGRPATPGTAATLVGHWVSLTQDVVPGPIRVELAAGLPPDALAQTAIDLGALAEPGDYLLVLDVQVPDHGSLTALGVTPTIVRVHVEAPLPRSTPDDGPGVTGPA